MNYLFNNPYPAGLLSIAELHSNQHVIKYMIKSPGQPNTTASEGTTAPEGQKYNYVTIGLWILLGAGIMLIFINSQTTVFRELESQKIMEDL